VKYKRVENIYSYHTCTIFLEMYVIRTSYAVKHTRVFGFCVWGVELRWRYEINLTNFVHDDNDDDDDET